MCQNDESLSQRARVQFERITGMSRELVSALYETVWAVNPEYDNLEALGIYLCQMAKQLFEHTQIRCRLNVSDIPAEIQVSSQTRHNITLVVKEAINNLIKHAAASEVIMSISFKNDSFDVSIRDNGAGFELSGAEAGHGLKNMKERMESIGGTYSVDSHPGSGTTVRLRLPSRTASPKRQLSPNVL
jgi:signal transduction histidine kinase